MVGHYEGYKTGHMLNDQLLSAILSQPKAFTIEVFEEVESPIHYYSEDWQNQI
jgi:UDP-3-O-[3-hydroxymyristoyl] N-acetylglucosamine deacetylase